MSGTLALMITLSTQQAKADISPEHGGAIVSVIVKGKEVLRPCSSIDALANDPRNAACFTCVPYFGRLYDGLAGASELSPTLPVCDPVYPLHGEGWISPWTVLELSKEQALLELQYTPREGGYPLPFISHTRYTLDENGLTIVLLLKNTSNQLVHAGLGLHPYFARHKDTALSFEADELWTPPQDHFSGSLSAAPEPLQFYNRKPLPEDAVDHSFTGFCGKAMIAQEDATILLESDAANLHLYAPADENYFCLEPVTQLPGAINDHTLAPGDQISLTMKLSLSD